MHAVRQNTFIGSEMASVFYQIMIIAVYGLSAYELMKSTAPATLAPAEQPPPFWKLTRRIAAAWLAFQVCAIVLLLVTNNWDRSETHATFYFTNAMACFVILPIGMLWQHRNGTPALPLFRREQWRQLQMSWRRALLLAALFVTPVVLTAILFLQFAWKPEAVLVQRMQASQHSPYSNFLFAAYILISAPVAEEILWRHYFLNRVLAFLRTRLPVTAASVIAVAITTLIFACGHGQMVDPAWLKYTQILLYGVALGICQLKLGTEASILVHLLYNLSAALIVTR